MLFRSGEDLKAGMVVFGARQPINDVYGTAAQKNVEPYIMYQSGRANNSWFITDKTTDKDLAPLLSMLDYLYTTEGGLLGSLGLSKEQYDETKNEFYTRSGLTEGAYARVSEEEVRGSKIYAWVDNVNKSGVDLASAVKANRFIYLDVQSLVVSRAHKSMLNNLDQWIWYENTGGISGAITNQVSTDEQKTISKARTNIGEFMAKSVPPFIKGEKDPFNDSDWEAYVKAISKYGPDKVTEIYQQKLDNLKK